MKRNEVAILDIGSSKIVCLVGILTADDFVVKARGQASYGGFGDATWYEPNKLYDVISFALTQAEQEYGSKINSLLVGVPGEFTCVSTTEGSCKFKSKKKINKDDVTEVFERADIFGKMSGLYPISRSVINFTIDDEIMTVTPIGTVANKLNGLISYMFVTEYFKSTIDEVLDEIGVSQYEYISASLAQALYLLPPEQRDKRAILIDVGYITTNVMLVYGDGLVFMKSFSAGGGHISADMCQVLEISFRVAEQLKQKLNLNLEFNDNDNYVLNGGIEIKAQQANEIAKARIEDIADYIVKCFDSCEYEIPSNTPIFITGGGLTYLRGGVEYLAKSLGKNIKVATTIDPLKRNPEYSSAYGLLNIAIQHRNKR